MKTQMISYAEWKKQKTKPTKIEEPPPKEIKNDASFSGWNDADSLLESPIPKPIELANPIEVLDPMFEKLLPHQRSETKRCTDMLAKGQSCQLIAPTGAGKTYFTAYLIHALRTKHPDKFPLTKYILYFTEPNVVIQTKRAIASFSTKLNVIVIATSQLRSFIGSGEKGSMHGGLFVYWEPRRINGELLMYPVWKPSQICLVIGDESQRLKNEDSQIAKIFSSLPDAELPAFFMSATPYSRPCHARTIALNIKPEWAKNTRLRARDWPSWIDSITSPASPMDWCPKAMKRLQSYLEPYTIRFKNIKYPHKTIVKKTLISFESVAKRNIYQEAFDEYQEALIQAGRDPLGGFAAVLVAQLKFREKAQLLRADNLAAHAIDLEKKGYNVIIAVSFQDTLKVVHSHLVSHGIKNISIIMGGQSAIERQQNIDDFQSEKNHFLLLMSQSGGCGLSLHHHTGNKRPRFMVLPPLFNDIEFVQLLGRHNRINNVSTAYAAILLYRGTVEERVAEKCSMKCNSLKEVAGFSEGWGDALSKDMRLKINQSLIEAPRTETEDESCDEVTKENEEEGPTIEI